MASAVTHIVVASALGTTLSFPKQSWRIWVLGAGCAIIPDLDVVGFWLGIPYADPLGHRGLSHSVVFAALLAALVVGGGFQGNEWKSSRWKLWTFFFFATMSHGLLDAMTNGGLGVAFFAPFDQGRYFFPFRPILVSPMSVTGFFTNRGWAILENEILWVWVPAICLAALIYAIRKKLGWITRSEQPRTEPPL